MLSAIIYPTVLRMRTIQTDIRTIQEELEQNYTETQAMRRTLRELDAVVSEVSTYNQVAMPVGDQLLVITELETLAKEHNLSQTLGATYQATPDKTVGLPYYNFSFVLSGTFKNVYMYLQALESQSYYVLINIITLSKTNEGNTTLRFDARIYVQKG